MRAVISTSSPIASVALFDLDGGLIGSRSSESHYNSSGAALTSLQELLAEHGLKVVDLTEIVADIGPGSFTGTKVAVTIVKTLGKALNIKTFGVSSFDLIDCRATVYIPSRKGEFFVRVPKEKPFISRGFPHRSVGYGLENREEKLPNAANLCNNCSIKQSSPEALVPSYLAPPSISTPKDSRVLGGGGV